MLLTASKRLRVFLLLAACAGLAAVAQRGDRQPIDLSAPPEHWEIPPAPVRSPEEALGAFELPAGFRIEVVASEPLVQDPIALAFDPDGRIWVVEYPSYNWPFYQELHRVEEEAPAGRIVVLEDTNGGGRMDRRTVFLDGLNGPRAVALVRDGVLVSDPPHIWFCRDTNGDGKADEKLLVADDLGLPGNPHAAPNGILYARDNWLYSIRYPARFRFTRDGWRRDEPEISRGQWGISQDDYGRFFYGYNQDHLRADLVPSHYWKRNPNLRNPAGLGVDVRIAQDQTVWPHAVTPGVNRRAHLRDDGTLRIFTANAGPVLYRGDHFPPEFYGNVFVCESAGNLVRRSVLEEEKGVITARNAYQNREFLFSHDERFRPVHAHAGPDGALYIVDMYRGIIEGYLFSTTFLRNQILDRALHEPFYGMGRIYRVVRDEAPAPARPRVSGLTAAQWVEYLSHPNGWWRDTAQRRIVESEDRSVAPHLRQLAASAENHVTRVYALWTLEGLGELDWPVLEQTLGDESFRVRMAAVRLSEPRLSRPEMLTRVLSLREDERIEVRRQLLLSLGESRTPAADRAMLALLQRDAGEPFMVEAAVNGFHGKELEILEKILQDPAWSEPRPASDRLLTVLSTAVLNEGRLEGLQRLVDWMDGTRPQPNWKRLALLEGLDASEGTVFEEAPGLLVRLGKVDESAFKQRFDEILARRESRAQQRASRPLTAEERVLVETGQKQYVLCGSCHGADGQGLAGVAPPLVNSSWILGREEALIRIVLHGMEARSDYPEMPPMHGLSDQQVAAVLTYIRREWDHQAEPVHAEKVAEVRKATAGRGEAWTEQELRELTRR